MRVGACLRRPAPRRGSEAPDLPALTSPAAPARTPFAIDLPGARCSTRRALRAKGASADDHSDQDWEPHHSPRGREPGADVSRRRVLPDAGQGGAGGEPLLARAHLLRPRHGQGRARLPELHRADAAPQHPGRLLRRQSQAAADAAGVGQDAERPLGERPGGDGSRRRRHRLRHVHAPARRPRRLEHAARERPLGADLPQGPLPVRRPRAGVLDAEAQGGRGGLALDRRIPCCRSSKPSAPTSSRATTR